MPGTGPLILSGGILDKQGFDPAGQSIGNQKPGQPYLLDLVTLKRCYFQVIPLELDYNPEANQAVIAQFGRNNPFYHYTGGEDNLNFSVSWYSTMEDKQDVLKKLKWIEALSKRDGDRGGLHAVQFIMGDLFKDAKWIVAKAPYRLRFFKRDKGMMPQLALQDIHLKRITPQNLTHDQIHKTTT